MDEKKLYIQTNNTFLYKLKTSTVSNSIAVLNSMEGSVKTELTNSIGERLKSIWG